MNIRELFTPATVAANWSEVASNRLPYIGEGLFPAKKKAGLDLKWIKGSKGLPVSLMPSAFDAKATFRDRIGVDVTETEMPFFREGFKIKERDRQEMLRVQDANDPYGPAILARIYDDANNLIEGAKVVPERMIMQLLFPENGNIGIAIKANGVDYTYNYDPTGAWKRDNYIALTGNDKWDQAATADPFVTLEDAKNLIAGRTGANLVTALMNGTTFNLIGKTDAVKNRWLTTIGRSMGYLTRAEVARTIKDVTGFDIAVSDKQYADEDKVAHKFIPDGYVALVPAGELGNTWFGTTPEEADLMGSNSNAEVSIVETGIAITREIQEHPVNINTYASEIVLPSYEAMDNVILLKVV